MKDKLIIMTEFKIVELRLYGELYEIERHAKALAEAWRKIMEVT